MPTLGRAVPGDIIEVLGVPSRQRYRVRWENKGEAIVYPAEDAVARPGHGSTKS